MEIASKNAQRRLSRLHSIQKVGSIFSRFLDIFLKVTKCLQYDHSDVRLGPSCIVLCIEKY